MTDAQSSLADSQAPSAAELEAFALSIAPLAAAFKVFEEPGLTMEDDLNVQCAQALGWRVEWGFDEEQGEEYGILYNPEGVQVALRYGTASLYTFLEDIPLFGSDLVRLLENEIGRRGLGHAYTVALQEIVRNACPAEEEYIHRFFNATAEQRARAFVAVKKGQQIHANFSRSPQHRRVRSGDAHG